MGQALTSWGMNKPKWLELLLLMACMMAPGLIIFGALLSVRDGIGSPLARGAIAAGALVILGLMIAGNRVRRK